MTALTLKKIYVRLKNECLYLKLSFFTNHVYYHRIADGEIKAEPEAPFCDLAVIAFNNSKVIEYQIRCLKRFFVFPYRYTVFDNSNNQEKAEGIKNMCSLYDVGYVRLPRQDFLPSNMGSYSHGIACNYAYRKFIANGGSTFIGFLDHDIFPIEAFDLSVILEHQPFYGIKHGFYLWPGFFFIRKDFAEGKQLDFRPSLHLHGDTGACNYYSLFRGVNFSKYLLVNGKHCFFDGKEDIFESGYSHYDCGWIHCWNTSNYLGKKNLDAKLNKIYRMLDEILA